MKQDVTLELISEQRENTGHLGEVIRTRNQYAATYHEKNGQHYLFYKEQMEGVDTPLSVRITWKDKVATITRSGEIRSEFVYDIREETHTLYETPFGELEMGIITNHISTMNGENQMKLTIDYELLLEGEVTSYNRLQFLVRER